MISSLLTVALAFGIAALVGALGFLARERDRRPASRILDDRRLAATAAAAASAARTDPALDDICAAVREQTGWDMAFVTAVGANNVHAIGRAGMPDEIVDADVKDSLCAIVASREEPLIIRQAELAAMVLGNCHAGRHLVRYAGVPVRRSGEVIGALAVSNVRRVTPGLTDDLTLRVLSDQRDRVEQVIQHHE